MARAFDFLLLAFRRLASKPLLSLLLVLNVALSVGITVGIPVFSGAVSMRILQQEIDARSRIRGWPMFSVRVSARPTARAPLSIEQAAVRRDWLLELLKKALHLPVTSVHVEVQSPMHRLAPREGDETYSTEYLAGVQVVYVADAEAHITILEGAPFQEGSDPAELAIWVEHSFAQDLGIQLGDRFDLGDLFSSWGETIPVAVAGLWVANDPADHFWPESPRSHFDGRFLVTADQFSAFILADAESYPENVSWYYVFDDRRVRLDRADQYIAGLQLVSREAQRQLPDGRLDLDPGEDLLRGQRRKQSLSVVLFGFSIPLLVILAYAISSLAETQSRLHEEEASMMVSRGSTPWQLLFVSAAESVAVVLAAIPIGIALALLLAHLLGYATGFLSFGLGEPLSVSLISATWTPMLVILGISIGIRLRVTWRDRRRTLIAYERSYTRPTLLRSVTHFFYLVLLILVTVYAYRQLATRGAILTSLDALDPRNDPLVLLAPTLFIFTAPLIASEAFTWLIYPLSLLGRFLPWTSGYLASTNLVRAGGRYRGAIYRLTLSLTLGVFYASVARSADIWLVESLQHRYGADLVIKLTEEQGDRFGAFGGDSSEPLEVSMVSSDVYRTVGGVLAATRVAEFEATLQPPTGVPYFRLFAVERLSFPEVAYFRSDYARVSLGELMNRLAQVPQGILLPYSVAAKSGLGLGDRVSINVKVADDTRLRFDAEIVGLLSFFPTSYPDQNPVLVANMDYLEMNFGLLPHDVWMKLERGADTDTVSQGVNQLGVPLRDIKDLNQALVQESSRLERTGVFGLLSFCFVAGAALSVADVLVYTTSMLRQRSLQHAVMRALGLEGSAVFTSVVLEQAVSLFYGIAVGVVCGVICALLYGPYFPLGDGTNPPVPPFTPYVDWPRTWWIALTTGAALLLAQVVVVHQLMRTHLSQVLRMGMHP